MNDDKRLPTTPEVLFVIISFLLIVLVLVSMLDLPIQIGLLLTWFIVMVVGLRIGHTYKDMQQGIIQGITNGMESIIILVAVGALIGTWIVGGVVPSIIFYGLSIVHPSVFLVTTFILCSITSLATGTSFGSAGTAGLAMMAIGVSYGMPSGLVAGAVISGAFLGDRLSPLSDTTVLAASMSKVDLMSHVRSMLYSSVPAFIIASLMFLFTGFIFLDSSGSLEQAEIAKMELTNYFNVGWILLIPAIVVIVLLIMRMPPVPVILCGALLGSLCAILFQGISPIESLNVLYRGSTEQTGVDFVDELLGRGGITSMLEVIMLMILALGISGIMETTGLLKTIGNRLMAWANSAGRIVLSTNIAAFLGNFMGSSYFSIISGSKLTEESYDRKGISRYVLSRNVESGGTLMTAMVPWADGGVFMAATLGVSTLSYLPFLWFAFAVIIIEILFGFTGKFIWYTDDDVKRKESA